jgi:hypothetical protein
MDFELNFSRMACSWNPNRSLLSRYAMSCMTQNLHIDEARRLIKKSDEINPFALTVAHTLDQRIKINKLKSLVSIISSFIL